MNGRRMKTPTEATPVRDKSAKPPKATKVEWNLRLYVAGQTPKSLAAFNNLKKLCEEHLAGRYALEVIDLLENPQLAKDHQIFAIPTLVRRLPEPLKRILGDLSNTERALVGLDLKPQGSAERPE